MIDVGEVKITVDVDDSDLKKVDKSLGDIEKKSSKTTSGMNKHWKDVKTPLQSLSDTIKDKVGSGLDKVATKFPKLSSAAKGMGTAVSAVGHGMATAFEGTVKVVETVGKATAAAATAATAAVGAIVKQSISSYADLEQLQGGADKIFGDASDTIVANSEKAAKAMGLTQQEYLDQALNMGSAMVKSLGGDQEKAAEYTDKAMKQMADNASVFGTDMEQVQNAYKGFAKENYTMLDNLKLGKPNSSV